jgi:hypothetical protein
MPFTGSVMKKQCGTTMIDWSCSVKVGDIVRRSVEIQTDPRSRLHSRVGVIIEELANPKTNELYSDSVFKVFWDMDYGAFAISESKLELVSDCYRNVPSDVRGNEL